MQSLSSAQASPTGALPVEVTVERPQAINENEKKKRPKLNMRRRFLSRHTIKSH